MYKEYFKSLGMETQEAIKEENTELTTYILKIATWQKLPETAFKE